VIRHHVIVVGDKARRLLDPPAQLDDLLNGLVDPVVRTDVDMHSVGPSFVRRASLDRGRANLLQDDLVLPRVPGTQITKPAVPAVLRPDDFKAGDL